MPINYKDYPDNWLSEIRPRILARDDHRCKFCGIADRTEGWWVPGGSFYTPRDWAASFIPQADEAALADKMARKPKPTRVVLTIAHLDHGLTNHEDDNLAALCQRCHLNHDRDATAHKRQTTRRYGGRKKQLPFDFIFCPKLCVRPTSTH